MEIIRGQPVVILIAVCATLVESIIGLAGCISFFFFSSCSAQVSCPEKKFLPLTGFVVYTSYVADSCNLSDGTPIFNSNENARTQPDDIFMYEVLYCVLYLAWAVSTLPLFQFKRGAWWASTWLLMTLAIVVFDLIVTSFILTDISYEAGVPPNCDSIYGLADYEDYKKYSIIAMALYVSRGGLVWLLNVVLLGWILNITIKTERLTSPVNLDTVNLDTVSLANEDDLKKINNNNFLANNNNNFWINRGFGEAANDDDGDYDDDEVRDKFRTGGRYEHKPHLTPTIPAMSHYAQPYAHLALPRSSADVGRLGDYRGNGDGSHGPGLRRNSSLLERIRAANNAPVAEGGLWSYGRLPSNGGQPLPAPPAQPEKDVDNAFGFLSSYDTVMSSNTRSYPSLETMAKSRASRAGNVSRSYEASGPSGQSQPRTVYPSLERSARPKPSNNPGLRASLAAQIPAYNEEAKGPFSIPRVKTYISRKVSKASSFLSSNGGDIQPSPDSEGGQKRYFVPLKP